ncbi:hypothetical protein ScPMuIL_000591 [Solemya velum]
MSEDGHKMSLYGKSYLTPEELAGLSKNVQIREERITKRHLANLGNTSVHWPGVRMWSKELESAKTSFFGKRTRKTVADQLSNFERLFHLKYGYDSKIHRDDRRHVLEIGAAVHDEESKRTIPLLSSSNYGHRLEQTAEPFVRGRVRIEHILKGFYYKRGTGLPPVDTTGQ